VQRLARQPTKPTAGRTARACRGVATSSHRPGGCTDGRATAHPWVSYGVGAACVATGAVLYYLGVRRGSAGSTSVALVPAFAPGQAGALLKGAF